MLHLLKQLFIPFHYFQKDQLQLQPLYSPHSEIKVIFQKLVVQYTKTFILQLQKLLAPHLTI